MDATKFGAFVQSQRKVLSLTQAQLGEKLGVTDKAISRWERGVGFPDISLLEPLAQALEVTVVELMRGEQMEQITMEEAKEMIVQTIDLAAEQQRTKTRSRMLRFVACPVIAVAWLFLTNVILWYVREPFWLRVVCMAVTNFGYGAAVFAAKYIAECQYLNTPKPLGEIVTSAISGVGVVIFMLSWVLNTDDVRHLYVPMTLLGLALIFAYPLYMAWRILTGRQSEEN